MLCDVPPPGLEGHPALAVQVGNWVLGLQGRILAPVSSRASCPSDLGGNPHLATSRHQPWQALVVSTPP